MSEVIKTVIYNNQKADSKAHMVPGTLLNDFLLKCDHHSYG